MKKKFMNKIKPEMLPQVSLVIAVALLEISLPHLLSAVKKEQGMCLLV